MESAKVLGTYGIKAYIFESLRPKPEYNGYKLYDESGCQLVPHQGDAVIELVEQVQDIFAIQVKSEEKLKAASLIEIIGEEIDTAYINAVKTLEINPNCNKKDLKIVFSPLHGQSTYPFVVY